MLLVGLPAAGASAVAEAVSAATGWPALDDVLLLQRTTGCTAAELVRLHGEPALRSAESDVLTLTLSVPPPLEIRSGVWPQRASASSAASTPDARGPWR